MVYGIRKAKRYRYCRNDDCIRGKACSFAYGIEELFCPTCGETGVQAMQECPGRFPTDSPEELD